MRLECVHSSEDDKHLLLLTGLKSLLDCDEVMKEKSIHLLQHKDNQLLKLHIT